VTQRKLQEKKGRAMKNIKTLKIIALVFPGLTLAVLLLFAFGETIGGDWSGLGHLIQAAPIVFLMWLGWRHPLAGGILFLVLSFVVGYSLGEMLRGPEWVAPFLIMITPLFLSGILLLGAAGLERKAA
jgi:FtsH-binding integral membrane protein